MTLANTHSHYGGVTKTFHWLTALLIFTVIPLGIFAYDMPYETSEQLARKALLFSLHKTVGVTIFFVAILRIIWAISQPKPGLLHADRKAESFLAELVHWLLYASLVIVPLAGWIHHSATTGFAPIWWPFGQSLPFVPKDEGLADATALLHKFFERVLVVSLFLHIAGALKHHVIDKDTTLRRMLPGTPNVPAVAAHKSSVGPIAAAAAIYIAVGASTLLVPAQAAETIDLAALEQVASDWTVQDGTLGITITQFGSEVQGSFSDWTAAISYDPTLTDGVKGNAKVTISTGSLTIGSVTDQALGFDFFNATDFPTAIFQAELSGGVEQQFAKGTLTIKDTSIPVDLPFTLHVDGDTATMSGMVDLNRLDFGIGDTMPDEGALGFNVRVQIDLTATR